MTVSLQAMSESVVDDYATYCKQDKIRYLEGDELTEATDAADEEICLFSRLDGDDHGQRIPGRRSSGSFVLEAKGLDPNDVTSDARVAREYS
ncbi:hypothetical protein BA011_26905 (plasmid) [Rhizobium leguminosarum]|uniref:Uncharacterized protein n=1 Tax=Rhizobium leguminosarum TaxID=384 RepID=A0A1B1CI03_RHILE|nr:hypothetical protein [Rhizobium leguminosarum]ANP89392.1 hypothetical protein BA011_26905 [Rhizobium leguminosarum]